MLDGVAIIFYESDSNHGNNKEVRMVSRIFLREGSKVKVYPG